MGCGGAAIGSAGGAAVLEWVGQWMVKFGGALGCGGRYGSEEMGGGVRSGVIVLLLSGDSSAMMEKSKGR